MGNMETYSLLLLLPWLIIVDAACDAEFSEEVKWGYTEDGGVAVSEPACLDDNGKYLTRECVEGKWYPEEPPVCAKVYQNKFCPGGYVEKKGFCLKVSPLVTFDELCPYPGLRYYNYSKINSTSHFWMPIRKINSTFIYTSIDKRYGREFKMEDNNITSGCFSKIEQELVPSDCSSLHHRLCSYNEGLLPNSRASRHRNTNMSLVLKFDKRREKVILQVYAPQKLANMTEGNEYAVYCFTDASINEMKTAVRKKLIYNCLHGKVASRCNHLVYQMSIKYPHAGQYWCEAYNLNEELIKSNKVIAYKKKKGNEYSLRVLLESICQDDCSWLTPELIYKYLEGINFNVIFDRIQVVLRVMKITETQEHKVDVVFHVSTQHANNVIGEYFRLKRTITERLPENITFISFYSSEACLPETVNGLTWKLTQIGNKITPQEFCVGRNGLPVMRACIGDFMGGAYWGDFEACVEGIELTPKTKRLLTISSGDIESRDMESVKNLTSEPEQLTSLDLFLVGNTLQMFNVSNQDEIVFENVIETVENILDGKPEILKESQLYLNATDTILDSMDKFLHEQSILRGLDEEVFLLRRNNVIIHITKPFLTNVSGIAVYPDDVRNMQLNETFDDLVLDDLDISVYIPLNLLEGLTDGEGGRNNLTVITTIFNNDKLFNSPVNPNATTSGRVVSVSIPDFGIYLKEPIPLLFRNEKIENRAECSFWEYGAYAPNKTGHWATSGGSNLGFMNDSYSECAFSHLTHFALLILSQRMLVDEDQDLVNNLQEVYETLDRHHLNLSIITLVGCTLSLIGIAGIFITAICFKRWRQKVGSKILIQLSITICLEMSVIHLAGSDYFPNKTIACNIVGICLHYVVLSKFSWMFVSAILQYIRFVKVLSVLPPRLVLKTMLIGWCLPLLPVIFVATFWPDNYSLGSQNFCYPTGTGLYVGLFLPVVLIVVANLIVFTLIMTNVLGNKMQGHGREKKTQKLQIYLGVLLFFMLGVPWIFGILAEILAVSTFQIVFVYLFCLTATLQGSVLFIFYILLNKDTRNLWMFAFREERSSYK